MNHLVRMYLSLWLPLLSLADGGTLVLQMFEALNQTNQVTRETPTLPPPYLHLPVFVDSWLPLVDKEHFSPSKGTGLEPLPEPVREILFPVRLSTSPPSNSSVSVRTLCKFNKMLVQVQRSIMGAGGPDSQLKLGTCQTSKLTRDYLYFDYDIGMCGTTRTIMNNQLAYSNTLTYDPPMLQGPIRRAAPFTLPVACYYNRYQYSYKIGYTPKMQMRKIFTPMKNGAKFILTPRNAQWERLSPSDQYMLGYPMYFEANAKSISPNERLYVNLCYITPEKSHTSTPQFAVVKNFGCMVESKDSHSRFIPYKNNAVRFSVDAFLFTGMMGQLYMHCSMSVGSYVPTPIAKSCNYDTETRRWVELDGPDSVCTCCDSNCSAATSKVTKLISSRPWTIQPKVKPTTAPKRRTVPPTTITTAAAAAAAAPQLERTRDVTKWRMTSQPEVIAGTLMGKVENTGKELEGLVGGEGVTWVEMGGEEKRVKGSAVVVEEVTQPHTIFEDIFDFDK
ncbi:zona pellucida sperm-binding protein 3d.2 isoform X2 [Etheostoma spectabile]|uniref:zona pellucida sperm-binding protein 3d.2 isoform X2 n=1 Tax=Etheostoma spectabile TaxID=54343 RepID=UPI0013AED446|nr:zona pellucida sperm-binding protein 3-like isoform X2 [Etheostoma spectabile]